MLPLLYSDLVGSDLNVWLNDESWYFLYDNVAKVMHRAKLAGYLLQNQIIVNAKTRRRRILESTELAFRGGG